MEKTLALFDFDGTITRRDTLIDFMIHVRGWTGATGVFLRLIPSAIAFFLKRISNQTFKERYLSLAFLGMEESRLRELGKTYLPRLNSLLRPGALERLNWHRAQGHRLVIVSASADIWLDAWCRHHEVELICSTMEFRSGRCTGRLLGTNCRGPEKVQRIRSELDTDAYETIYAYGDSSGDTEMLAFAGKGFYRPFHRNAAILPE